MSRVNEIKKFWEQIKERDGGMCRIPLEDFSFCGNPGIEPCHIIPKSRGHWRGINDVQNGIWGCRECHSITHTFEGRKRCIKYLRDTFGYDYSDKHYQEYLSA